MEREQFGFRVGESTGKPIGGNVANEPLPKALYELASARGYKSQLSLARELGYTSRSSVSSWYLGKAFPTPESMGKLLVLLEPNDEELDSIIEPWREGIINGKGRRGLKAKSESAVKAGHARIKSSDTPFGIWIEEFARKRGISLRDVLGTSSTSERDHLGLEQMSDFLQNAPDLFGLTNIETDELAETIAKTIEDKISGGHEFKNSLGARIKKMQQDLQCTTFTGQQAAELLGTSRQNIHIIRHKMGLPLLLSEDHIIDLKSRLDTTEEHRRRIQDHFRNGKSSSTEEAKNS